MFFILKDGGNDKYYYTEQNKSNHIAEQASFTEQINAKSPKNKYVESITLNGESYTKNYITHEDILNGGTLVFKMKN